MKKPDWNLWMEDKKECTLWLENYMKKGMLKKSKDESKLHIKKADHNLNFANWILEKHKDEIPNYFGNDTYYDWVIDIFYYTIYHAALALVSREGYKSKSHSATLCFLIHFHYHKTKSLAREDVELVASSLNKEDIEIVGMSKELREKASYDVHESFEKKLAEQIREQVVNFSNKIKEILQ